MSKISLTLISGRSPFMLTVVSSVSALPAESRPLTVVVRTEGLLFCQMRKLRSTKPWCSQKMGSAGAAKASCMTAPMPLWPQA